MKTLSNSKTIYFALALLIGGIVELYSGTALSDNEVLQLAGILTTLGAPVLVWIRARTKEPLTLG